VCIEHQRDSPIGEPALTKLGGTPPAAWQGPDIKIPEIQKSKLPKTHRRTNSKASEQGCKSTDLINHRDGYAHRYITHLDQFSQKCHHRC
jgi:hypothetical protein